MALNIANLVQHQRIGGFQFMPIIWDYSTSDNLATVDGSTYFDLAHKNIRLGDWVRTTASDGKVMYLIDGVSFAPGSESVSLFKIANVSSFV